MSTVPPDGLPDRPMLRHLAGEKVFERGTAYFDEGRVRLLRPGSDRVSARVEGTQGYRVKLWQARGELQWSCTCPMGREAVFCKHAVATGLAWLGSMTTGADGRSNVQNARRQEEGRRELIHQHLATVDRERLITLLLEATDFDDILHRRLLLESIGIVNPGGKRGKHARTSPPDFSAYRQILREAIETSEYVDYDALPDYAQGVEEAIQPFGDLLQAGHAAAVVDLCEFALVELDRTAEMLDGGDGSLNRTYDALQYYHLEACRAARPEPKGLAARLLGYELEGGLGIFNNTIKVYGDVLGLLGQAEWRRLLTAQWEAVNTVPDTPAKLGAAKPIDHRRYQLQALMESLAEFEGDVDALIRIKERDLSSAHDFLALAELCLSHDRHDEALSWTERGLKKFSQWPDSVGLRDFLLTELNRRGRYEEALKIVWADFARVGNLENFRRLKEQVRHQPKHWSMWRAKALAHLRGKLKKARTDARRTRWLTPPDSSALVDILLDEQADEEAWTEAQTGGCNAGLALRLAARREKAHPEDALRIYRERLGPIIARGGQNAYKEAVELLKKMRTVLTSLDRAGEFKTLRDEVRATHSRKRSFVKLLDAATA